MGSGFSRKKKKNAVSPSVPNSAPFDDQGDQDADSGPPARGGTQSENASPLKNDGQGSRVLPQSEPPLKTKKSRSHRGADDGKKSKKLDTKTSLMLEAVRGPCKVIQETYADKVYFDEKELKRLKKKFVAVDLDKKGEITLEQFGNLTELISHNFRERILDLTEDKLKAEKKQRLNFDDFAKILSVFHYKCPQEIKMRYLFRIYDINGDNFVDEKDIITMMKTIFFLKEIRALDGEGGFETLLTNEEFVENMANDIIAAYDVNGDRQIELFEFKEMILDGDLETRMNIAF